MEHELRRLQNRVFGLARSMKGINNDINTRHKSRARGKLTSFTIDLFQIIDEADDIYNKLAGVLN